MLSSDVATIHIFNFAIPDNVNTKRLILALTACCSAFTTMAALAQHAAYSGPSTHIGYVGPSAVPTMTVRQLLSEGRDDQYVKLIGKIVRHAGGDRYIFADASGELQ